MHRVVALPHLLRDLPRECRLETIPRARADPCRLLRHPADPRASCRGRAAPRADHIDPRPAEQIRPARRHRALDVPDLALRLGNRSDRVCDALPDLLTIVRSMVMGF